MFSVAELIRKVKNIIRITTIVTPNETKALATIRVGKDDESIEFPVMSLANSFKRHWIPIRKDEQVLVFHPFGNANKGYILRGLFYKILKEPRGADNDTEIIEFEDGTRIEYNSRASTLKILVKGETLLLCKTLRVKADNVTIDSVNIKLDSGGKMKTSGEILAKGCNLSIHTHKTNCGSTTALPCTA